MAKFTILESHHFPRACTRSVQIHTRKRKYIQCYRNKTMLFHSTTRSREIMHIYIFRLLIFFLITLFYTCKTLTIYKTNAINKSIFFSHILVETC